MTDLRRLFEQEMRALLEEGEAFAKNFPEAARYLESTKLEDRDPYVERMIEGVAFMTARVRELADETDNDLDSSMLEQLVPDLIQPLPSVSVVRFAAIEHNPSVATIRAGAMVRTVALPGIPNGVSYRLLHPVNMTAAKVTMARMIESEKADPVLELEFAWSSIRGNHSWPDSLQLFLLGDAPIVWMLRYALSQRVTKIEMGRSNQWNQIPLTFGLPELPCYTTENDLATPLAKARDFLCSDERFRFVELRGLSLLTIPTKQPVRIRIHLRGPLPRGIARAIKPSVFQTNTGIVVNRSSESLQGISWDHTQMEVPLRPLGGTHREVLDVVSVRGFDVDAPHHQIQYRKYSSFRRDNHSGVFNVAIRTTPKGRTKAMLGLAFPDLTQDLRCQNLAIEGICCDGDLPHQNISGSQISQPTRDIPSGIGLTGIVRPSPCYRMPRGRVAKSLLLSATSGHYNGWLEASRLKDGLRHVVWDKSESKLSLVETIQDVSTQMDQIQVQGVFWRRMVVNIRLRDTTCTPDTWDRLGMLHAFGSVLRAFVRDETPIGARCLLRLSVDPAGVQFNYEDSP